MIQSRWDWAGGRGRGPDDNSPAFQGWGAGARETKSPVRDGRIFLSSLTGLCGLANREPSHEWLGYFQKAGADEGPGLKVFRAAGRGAGALVALQI